MPEQKNTLHLVTDLKTRGAYALVLDPQGNCVSAQALNIVFETLDGRKIRKFGPLVERGEEEKNPFHDAVEELPYGQVSHAVEYTDRDRKGKIFTIEWPTKADAARGARPHVTSCEVPDDLVSTGLVPRPRHYKSSKRPVNEERLRVALEEMERDVVGQQQAKTEIRTRIAVARRADLLHKLDETAPPPVLHMAVVGSTGAGKNLLVEHIGKIYYALGYTDTPHVMMLTRGDLVGTHVGFTAPQTRAKITEARRRRQIMALNEAYDLVREENPGNDFGPEALVEIMAAMDNKQDSDFIFVPMGYEDKLKVTFKSNQGAKNRLPAFIHATDPTMEDLSKIMDIQLRRQGFVFAPGVKEQAMKLLAESAAREGEEFGKGRAVENLVARAGDAAALRADEAGHLLLPDAMTAVQKAEILARLRAVTLEDIMKVDLTTLSGKKDAKKNTIGFAGAAFNAGARNDNAAGIAPAVAVVPHRTIGFKGGGG